MVFREKADRSFPKLYSPGNTETLSCVKTDFRKKKKGQSNTKHGHKQTTNPGKGDFCISRVTTIEYLECTLFNIHCQYLLNITTNYI